MTTHRLSHRELSPFVLIFTSKWFYWLFHNFIINHNAVGMAVAWPGGFEIDFVRNPISGSAEWFFVIIMFHFYTHLRNQNLWKKIFDTKKIIFKSRFLLNRLPLETFRKVQRKVWVGQPIVKRTGTAAQRPYGQRAAA